MEILFLWLEKYRNFTEQGFNFSAEFIFNFEKDAFSATYKLSISKNSRFIPHFFGYTNITNVTAIVGQNGSGKTSILEFIKTQLPSVNQEWETRGVIAFQNGNEKTILVPDTFKLSTIGDLEGFNLIMYPFRYPKEGDQSYGTLYDNARYVYYSNVVDLKNEDIFQSGITNLSTLALIKSDNFIQEENDIISTEPQTDSFSKYKANEIRRNVQFLTSENRNLLPFILPEYLDLTCLQNDKKILEEDQEDVRLLIKKWWSKDNVADLNMYVLNQFYASVFFNTLVTYRKRSSLVLSIPLRVMRDTESVKDYILDFYVQLGNYTYSLDNNENVSVSGFIELSKRVPEFFRLIEELIEKSYLEISNYENSRVLSMRFAIRKDTEEHLNAFLRLYIQVKGITEFLDFNWRSLSSGQQSFFSFLSRFYHLKITETNLEQSLIILIDEGDIYFHPEWQKQFFDNTINFISLLFPDKEIQLIFTSNTPFITSDLPKDYIVFIENVESSNPKIKNRVLVHGPDNSQPETFAGNIHTLFADSFYMKGALIGNFAKKRIDSIIDYLRNNNLSERRDDYFKTIHIIGEPILRVRLLQMWDEKFGTSEEIIMLEERIKNLRNKKQ
jgi:AAA ATPase domain